MPSKMLIADASSNLRFAVLLQCLLYLAYWGRMASVTWQSWRKGYFIPSSVGARFSASPSSLRLCQKPV
jgi:hypothetical protein